MGRQFGHIVQRARPYDYRHRLLVAQPRFQSQHRVVIGVQLRQAGKDDRIRHPPTGGAELPPHDAARRGIGVLIRDQNHRLVTEVPRQHSLQASEHATTDHDRASIARRRERSVYPRKIHRLTSGLSRSRCLKLVGRIDKLIQAYNRRRRGEAAEQRSSVARSTRSDERVIMTWNPIWGQAMCPPLVVLPIRAKRTVQLAVTSSQSGDKVRLRFSNIYGKRPYVLGECTVKAGGVRALVTLEGRTRLVIPCGGLTYSDTVPLHVTRGSLVEVSMYFLNRPAEGNAIEAAYVVKGRNVTHGEESLLLERSEFQQRNHTYPFIPALDAIEVESPTEPEVIVAFGDSITQQGEWTRPLAVTPAPSIARAISRARCSSTSKRSPTIRASCRICCPARGNLAKQSARLASAMATPSSYTTAPAYTRPRAYGGRFDFSARRRSTSSTVGCRNGNWKAGRWRKARSSGRHESSPPR